VEVSHGNIWSIPVEGMETGSDDAAVDSILSTLKFTN
jgi:hypothetical protein